jgi:hypothetical protein
MYLIVPDLISSLLATLLLFAIIISPRFLRTFDFTLIDFLRVLIARCKRSVLSPLSNSEQELTVQLNLVVTKVSLSGAR